MRGVILLLFLGLIVSSSALADSTIVPFAFLVVVQSLSIRPVQGNGYIKTEAEPYPTNPHRFFTSVATSRIDIPQPRSMVLSEKCSRLWDILEPTPEKQYKSQFKFKNDDGSDSPHQISEKFTKTLFLARAEGGSTKQMMDLAFGKKYLPTLKVAFAETDEEYGSASSTARYEAGPHRLMFSPSFQLNSTSAEEASRIFIHEATHATETLKNNKGLPFQYIIRSASPGTKNYPRFSSLYKVEVSGDMVNLNTKEERVGYPYLGQHEKEIFDKEYENCMAVLDTVSTAIVSGNNLENVDVENTAGMKMSAQTVFKYYEEHHVNVPFFPLGPFDTIKQSKKIKKYNTPYSGRSSAVENFKIPGTNYIVEGKYHHKFEIGRNTFLVLSFENIAHNFVATLFYYNLNLGTYLAGELDAEKISFIKQYYKTQFISSICPGLEAFFMSTNQRFKEDLIEACETADGDMERAYTF